MVFNHDVSGEGNLVGEDIIVANDAVVRHVNADHQEVARAYTRLFAFAARAMQCYAFAYQVIVAYDKTALLAFELHVLRQSAQNGVFADSIPASQNCELFDDDMRSNLAAL